MSAQTSAPVEVAREAEPGPDQATEPERRRRSPLLVVGLGLLGLVLLVALIASLLTPHDPRAISGAALEEPSAGHPLGTDVPGRDIFAQLVFGARTSLTVATVSASLAMAGALLFGVLPALVGGAADSVSNRLMVFLLALPGLPLLVLVGSLAGESHLVVIVLIGFLGIAPNARILRSQTLALVQRGFISASQGFGGGPLYVLRRHLVPALGPLILVGFVNWAGLAVALEAGLAFLGLGDPSGISWGLMLNRALAQPSIYFSPMWTWWVLPAGLAVTFTVLAFTFVGVALEPSFNPRWLRSS
ncbi:MAG TPA: ABC transporter permease [Acidimicrobiales bacterium]|nr:ABC transporter permease [Acidimicrobiales bacterium]